MAVETLVELEWKLFVQLEGRMEEEEELLLSPGPETAAGKLKNLEPEE